VRCGGASGSARKKIFRITRSDRFLGGNARSLNDHQGIFHPCCRRSIRTSTGFPRTEIALSQVAPVQSSLRWSMPKRHDIAVVPTCVSRSPPHDRHERSIAWLAEKLFSDLRCGAGTCLQAFRSIAPNPNRAAGSFLHQRPLGTRKFLSGGVAVGTQRPNGDGGRASLRFWG